MSEFEFGLIVAANAFSRWTTRCMAAAGQPDLNPLDILILHNLNRQDREKRLSDICFLLNIEDTHTVNYSLRKLLKSGLISSDKRGKEVFYSTSDAGADLCAAYRDIRRQCLLDAMHHSELTGPGLRELARALRAVSGQYDQAARAAATL